MGNAPKDASPPPEKAAEDEDILKLLNSAAWEKRLDAARQQRERVLAERAKSGAPRKPTLFPKAVPPERMPVLKEGQAKAPRTAANRPAPAAQPSAASRFPTLPKVDEKPEGAPTGDPGTRAAVQKTPPLPPVEPAKVTRRPITPVRVALGFGLGLVVGVGVSSVSVFFKSDPVPAAGAPEASATVAEAADQIAIVTPAAVPDLPADTAPVTDASAAVTDPEGKAPDLSTDSVALSNPPEATSTVADISGPEAASAPIVDTPADPEIETSAVDALQTPIDGEMNLPVDEASPFQPAIPVLAPMAELPPAVEPADMGLTSLAMVPRVEAAPDDATKPGEPSKDPSLASVDPPPAPPATPAPAASDATAPAGETTYPPHQVIIYAPGNADQVKVETERKNLTTAGFTVDQPRAVDLTIKKDQVRFYHDEDTLVAEAVARKIGAETRDFTKADNRPPSGTIEVWFAGDAPKAAKQAPANKQVPVKKKKKNQAPAASGPSESQQMQMLRDRIVSQLKKGEYN